MHLFVFNAWVLRICRAWVFLCVRSNATGLYAIPPIVWRFLRIAVMRWCGRWVVSGSAGGRWVRVDRAALQENQGQAHRAEGGEGAGVCVRACVRIREFA